MFLDIDHTWHILQALHTVEKRWSVHCMVPLLPTGLSPIGQKIHVSLSHSDSFVFLCSKSGYLGFIQLWEIFLLNWAVLHIARMVQTRLNDVTYKKHCSEILHDYQDCDSIWSQLPLATCDPTTVKDLRRTPAKASPQSFFLECHQPHKLVKSQYPHIAPAFITSQHTISDIGHKKKNTFHKLEHNKKHKVGSHTC